MVSTTSIKFYNNDELLAVIHFSEQKETEYKMNLLTTINKIVQFEPNYLKELPSNPSQKEEIEWLLQVLAQMTDYNDVFTLSESSFDWLVANGYDTPMKRITSENEAKKGIVQLAKGDTAGFNVLEIEVLGNAYYRIEKDREIKFGMDWGF